MNKAIMMKSNKAERLLHTVRILLVICLLLLACQAVAEEPVVFFRDPMEHFFHQSFNALDEEIELAAEEKKTGVMIMFVDKDCPWCQKMKDTIMNRSDVQEYYRKHFRLLTLDVNGDTQMTDFAGEDMTEKDFAFQKHRVRATPVFMFFDNTGKVLTRFTGITRDADEFIWLAEYVVSGEYRNTNFTRYKQMRKKQEKVVSLN